MIRSSSTINATNAISTPSAIIKIFEVHCLCNNYTIKPGIIQRQLCNSCNTSGHACRMRRFDLSTPVTRAMGCKYHK